MLQKSELCMQCCTNDLCNVEVLSSDGTRIIASLMFLIVMVVAAIMM